MLTLSHLTLTGPALPDFYVQHELEGRLKGLLPSPRDAEACWRAVRRALGQPLTETSGPLRVRHVALAPLLAALGYGEPAPAGTFRTREGDEPGGMVAAAPAGSLRCWAWGYATDLDAPVAAGQTSRYTPQRIAERVLLAAGERLGLVTNGVEMRLILSEPARAASTLAVSLREWRARRAEEPPPDDFRLLLALGSPAGAAALPEILEDARLKQSKVTKDLRAQARAAVEGFVQALLDAPENRAALTAWLAETQAAAGGTEAEARALLARTLWREALVVVYRLLFILSGEAGTRERLPFSFASVSLWRHTYSPSAALGPVAQQVMESGAETGHFLAEGLRALFRLFVVGIASTELAVRPLGGALFGPDAAPLVDALTWSERGCALLLDRLLRAPRGTGRGRTLARLSYRDLDVEELGRVYEALLELEPGLTAEPMVRLRRGKLEVVVPAVQGERYRAQTTDHGRQTTENAPSETLVAGGLSSVVVEEDDEDTEANNQSAASSIQWIEALAGPGERYPLGVFYLRVGLGRKASGSFYTPESFVRFLVQETLGPLCEARSPAEDPQPNALLELNVLDPAMGSGHFLVGACRYLGEQLYQAARACAERGLWERIPAALVSYLPGRAPEGGAEAGLSAERARAIAKRLVAINCLYGVDKNPLAVELAKVSLWLESFAEGLPLTFLDHRLVCGDSLLGPLDLAAPLLPPYADKPLDRALTEAARERLRARLQAALQAVRDLDATLGADLADLAHKQAVKQQLEAALAPFVTLGVAWSGGVMLGPQDSDPEGYAAALEQVAGATPDDTTAWTPGFRRMWERGQAAGVLIFPLTFPEVFFPAGDLDAPAGFDAVLGNPPWDKIMPAAKEFYAGYDISVVGAESKADREAAERHLQSDPIVARAFQEYWGAFEQAKAALGLLYQWQNVEVEGERSGAQPDAYRYFCERAYQLLRTDGMTGMVLPSAFHANEGATGVRRLYLEKMALRCCFSFENRLKLFEIHSRFKFATVVARKSDQGTEQFDAAFYLHDSDWLFSEIQPGKLRYKQATIRRLDTKYLSLIELQSSTDLEAMEACYEQAAENIETLFDRLGVTCGEELNKTRQSSRFRRLPESVLGDWQALEQSTIAGLWVYEGRNIWQFSDRFEIPVYYFPYEMLPERSDLIQLTIFYRFGYRLIAGSTNERTLVAAVVPPGIVCTQSVSIERNVKPRSNHCILGLCAFWNVFVVDWLARQKIAATVNKFLLETLPVPDLKPVWAFLAHSALRLVCNHAGYAPLWQEQVGAAWREPSAPQTWPVLAGEAARWEVRAAVDAVVAQAYGLARAQYEHILHSFDRASGVNPHTERCLAAWDELQAVGRVAFTQRYDPYWDIPLVESLPEPVIELPRVAAGVVQEASVEYELPTDLFGNPLPQNLFGEVVMPGKRRGRRKG